MAAPPPMGSTTDESDWNRPSYPTLKPANPHFHSLEQPKKEIRFSPQRNLTPQHPPKKSIKPRAGPQGLQSVIPVAVASPMLPSTRNIIPAVALPPLPITPIVTSAVVPPPLTSTPNLTAVFATPLLAPTAAITSSTASGNLTEVDRSWTATRDSVINHMVNEQGLPGLSTPATVPQTKRAKTGGRRGRAGRHAGGRPPKVKLELTVNTPTMPGDVSIPSGSRKPRGKGKGMNIGRGRGFGGGRPRGSRAGTSVARGMGRGIKRKREDEDEGDKDDTDASETYGPLPTQSRSGRKISKVASLTHVPRTVIDLEPNTVATPTEGPKTTEKLGSGKKEKGKKRYRKPGETSVCKNCGRGHSPASNVIVFCDGCNTPWHQHCHDPPIPWDVVRIEEQEWHCAVCEVLREERIHLEGKVSAEGLSLVEKRHYLQTLPPAHLISLLLHASTLHPTLPIFSPHRQTPFTTSFLPPPPQQPPTFDFPTRSTNPPVTAEEDETYYELPSDYDPLPYPKPGNGVRLPPEEEDLALLVDEDVKVFSRVGRAEGGDVWGLEGLDGAMGLRVVGREFVV